MLDGQGQLTGAPAYSHCRHKLHVASDGQRRYGTPSWTGTASMVDVMARDLRKISRLDVNPIVRTGRGVSKRPLPPPGKVRSQRCQGAVRRARLAGRRQEFREA